MKPTIVALLEQIDHLEDKLEAEFEKHRSELGFGGVEGRVSYDTETLHQHLEFKTGLLDYALGLRLTVALTGPLIYAMIVPIFLIDLATMIYQTICFPLYRLERVRRRNYFVFDRRHLVYLNVLEKFNCVYCAYANGVLGFVREVTARTEKYWCPIKHARRLHYAHSLYAQFHDYGDAKAHKDWLDGYLVPSVLWPSRGGKPRDD